MDAAEKSALKLEKKIVRELEQHANETIAAGSKRYFKETIQPRGIPLPKIRKIAESIWKMHKAELDLETVLVLTERLFETGYWEDPVVGMHLARKFEKRFGEKELDRFEKWVDCYINNWAHCDDLCPHLIAPILAQSPRKAQRLKTWPQSENRWKRRASIVSFVSLAKKGNFNKEILGISKSLLADQKDDLVHKGNGWVLRELGKGNQQALLVFLRANQARIPRVTMRYALERTPLSLRKGL